MGLLLVAGWLRARRALPVLDRVAPFVLAGHVTPAVERRGIDRRSVLLAVLGGAIGAVSVRAVGGGAPALLAGAIAGAVGAIALVQKGRTRSRRRSSAAIDESLPDVVELLACAVSAGESPFLGLARAGREVGGPLAQHIEGAVASVRAGASLPDALAQLASESGSDAVSGFTDAVIVAMERGTPLTDVLQAQAADARARQRRRFVESAGRRDIAMLVPVVFLILPAVVVVALYPALVGLRLIVP
jgi:tight adherence protein C